MNMIGIWAFCHDSAACLVLDGEITAAEPLDTKETRALQEGAV